MAAKPALIAAGIVGALVLSTGGYFANEWRVCSGIEEDFLDTAYSIRSGARTDRTLAAIGSTGPTPELQKARDLQLNLLERQLGRIYERCGSDAGKGASRKAEDILYAP
jgi:hypothetical protein